MSFDQIFGQTDGPSPSLTQLRLLASVTDLCSSTFARAHGGRINLSNHAIAAKSGGYFSARQVSDHLHGLQLLDLLTIEQDQGKRWIKLKRPHLAELPKKLANKFVPWVDFEQGHIELSGVTGMNISEQFVLSYLANEACIFARSNMGFCLPMSNVVRTGRLLTQGKVLSRDTMSRALNSLQEKRLISFVTGEHGQHNPYLIFELSIAARYRDLLHVRESVTATNITDRWAFNQIVDCVDNPVTRVHRAAQAKMIPGVADYLDVLVGLPEGKGTLIITEEGYIDPYGRTHIGFDQGMPYFEHSLAQHSVLRESCEPFPPKSEWEHQDPLPEGTRYTEITRSQFYGLDPADQWAMTIDEALDDPSLTSACKKAYQHQGNFCAEAKKAILMSGLTAQNYKLAPEEITPVSSPDAPRAAAEPHTPQQAAEPSAKEVQSPAPEAAKKVHAPAKKVHIKNDFQNVFTTYKNATSSQHRGKASTNPKSTPTNSNQPLSTQTAAPAAAPTSTNPKVAALLADGWDPAFIGDLEPEPDPMAEAMIDDGWDPAFVYGLEPEDAYEPRAKRNLPEASGGKIAAPSKPKASSKAAPANWTGAFTDILAAATFTAEGPAISPKPAQSAAQKPATRKAQAAPTSEPHAKASGEEASAPSTSPFADILAAATFPAPSMDKPSPDTHGPDSQAPDRQDKPSPVKPIWERLAQAQDSSPAGHKQPMSKEEFKNWVISGRPPKKYWPPQWFEWP